jgi:hypothetical protein
MTIIFNQLMTWFVKMYMPYTAFTDDDDEASAEVHIGIIINVMWTDRR